MICKELPLTAGPFEGNLTHKLLANTTGKFNVNFFICLQFTWLSVAPLRRRLVWWWWGHVSQHRSRQETALSVLTDDIFKIISENSNRKQLMDSAV